MAKVEIEIADEILSRVPTDMELAEIRGPRGGDTIIQNNDYSICDVHDDFVSPSYRLILRKKFDPVSVAKEWWPRCLKGAAVARNIDGRVYLHQQKPEMRVGGWWSGDDRCCMIGTYLTPPPIPDDVPWTEAIIYNPWRE